MKYFYYAFLLFALIMLVNIGFNHFSAWGTIALVIVIIGLITQIIINKIKKQNDEKND
jgi:cbb3-type cytochrome oxidase subunit 3